MTQTAEAQLINSGLPDYTAGQDLPGGSVVQRADGRVAVVPTKTDSGFKVAADEQDGRIYSFKKAASVVITEGAPVYWDHSARRATPVPPLVAGDKDFFLGVCSEDAAGAETEVRVKLNQKPQYILDLFQNGFDTVLVGAATLFNRAGSLLGSLTTAAEAQKMDALSKRSFAIDSKWIVEGVFEVVTNGDADVVDVNLGVANGTHASDADAITESVFVHLDPGKDLNIMAESDDGTTEVNATDTTVDWAVGTPFHFCIDGRDRANIKFYINGIRVLSGSTFTLAAATGPLMLLAHIEKSANDSPGAFHVDYLTVRIGGEAD